MSDLTSVWVNQYIYTIQVKTIEYASKNSEYERIKGAKYNGNK